MSNLERNQSEDASSNAAMQYVNVRRLLESMIEIRKEAVSRLIQKAKQCMESSVSKTYLKRILVDLQNKFDEAETENRDLVDRMVLHSEEKSKIEETVALMEELEDSVRQVVTEIEDHLDTRAYEALSVMSSNISERTCGSGRLYNQSAKQVSAEEKVEKSVNSHHSQPPTGDAIEDLENSVPTMNIDSQPSDDLVKQLGVALPALRCSVMNKYGEWIPVLVQLSAIGAITLVRDGLLDDLELEGEPERLELQGVVGEPFKTKSRRVVLQIQGVDEVFDIEASSIPRIRTLTNVPWPQIKSRWQHLADLPLREVGGVVDISLGSDYAHLFSPMEQRFGKGTYAYRTRLGWVASGKVGPAQCKVMRLTTIIHAKREKLPKKKPNYRRKGNF